MNEERTAEEVQAIFQMVMNRAKDRAWKTLLMWAVPHIQGRGIDELLSNLSDEFVNLHQSALRSANPAIVITAIAQGNGLRIKD